MFRLASTFTIAAVSFALSAVSARADDAPHATATRTAPTAVTTMSPGGTVIQSGTNRTRGRRLGNLRSRFRSRSFRNSGMSSNTGMRMGLVSARSGTSLSTGQSFVRSNISRRTSQPLVRSNSSPRTGQSVVRSNTSRRTGQSTVRSNTLSRAGQRNYASARSSRSYFTK